MRTVRREIVLAAAVGLLATVASGLVGSMPAGASASPKLYVAATGDTDAPNTCRLASHPCATVAYAQTQAPVGSTIELGSGTFTAPISITASVNIAGKASSGANATILNPTTTVADTDSTYENPTPQTIGALVDVSDGATATIANIDIEGSGASPGFDNYGCQNNFVGVYFHNASGTLSGDTINGVELEPALFGCQDGLAANVSTDAGAASPSTVSFSKVRVTNYDKNGITCNDAGTTCTVGDSAVVGIGPTGLIAQNGIQLGFGAAGSVTGSTSSDNSYTGGGADNQAMGVLIYDTGATTVSGNKFESNDVNIFAGADSGAVSGAWSITGNTVTGATDNVPDGTPGNGEGNQYGDGIQIEGVDSTNPTSVETNTVTGSYEYGIGIYGSQDATVSDNSTLKNYDGVYVDSLSSANAFSSNQAKGNLRYDYEDTSSGSGTAGTADTWTTNSCNPHLDSAPEGLC
jgi:parallel beta-helix repeat protein